MKAIRVQKYEDRVEGKVCYWKEGGWWMIHTANGLLGHLGNHTVVEHEDGSITVTPSILISLPMEHETIKVHGFLTRGEWRDA